MAEDFRMLLALAPGRIDLDIGNGPGATASAREALQIASDASAPGAQFRTYPIYSSGQLPRQVTHQVRGYGDVWLYSPVAASWQALPIGP